ncbi:hypothetical protein FJR45_02690 [Sulfurimonas sediminis]|uniref:Uncharacterized protein n=1 Tax=Sulfurimonas sediminis TaxID=2590020 RepID=A0A7M1AZN8_9BACT|nr:hypothetical protein [Sulfurimonas sediminis]QOP42914.1 hypothetical protein FJR45_02690 [Sulfurimonas sediminis]
MVEFLKKAMDWVLEKEAEAAKKCAIDPADVEKQIKILEAKRAELRKKFEEEDAEFGHILSRLSLIKANASKCKTK